MRPRVAVLLGFVAIGVVALALALILRSAALTLVGVLTFVPALMVLWIGAIFARRPPSPDERHDYSFLGWLWRQSAPPENGVEGSGHGRDRGPAE
jgi:hypothetical protein